MESNDIIAACSKSVATGEMKNIIHRAVNEISKDGNFKIHYNEDVIFAKKLPAKHYFKIWKLRFDMLSAKSVTLPGLEELIESLQKLPEETPLRLVIAEYSDWHITFWFDDNDAVIGCLFKEVERNKRMQHHGTVF